MQTTLFPTTTAPLKSTDKLITDAHEVINNAVAIYQPARVFALFSGGYDSLCSVHVASQHPAFSGVVHINTGIGIPETNQFVRDTCRDYGWALHEYHPPVPYEEIILQHGFPGPGGHLFMYTRLKERCLQQLMRDCRNEDNNRQQSYRILLLTGVRSQESSRRMGTVEPLHKDGSRVWCAPIHDWSKFDIDRYRAHFNLPSNEVRDVLCMSGECLCGSFSKPHEIKEIEYWYPETAQRIHDLEDQAKAAGVHCVWGTRPPHKPKEDNGPSLFEMPLCSSCAFRHDRDS